MSNPHLPRGARERLARGRAGMASVVDGDALTMLGLFGLTWAIPAAVLRAGAALGAVLRRGHSAPRAA